MQRAEDVLEAAKKQTVYEVLLNAMAAAKTKHSVELGPGSLYGQLISRTRAMPPDVKAMLGHEAAEAAAEAAPRPRSRSRSKSRTRSGDLAAASASAPTPRQSRADKKKESYGPPPSVKKKFEEHGKRKVIAEFLNTPKKPSVVAAVQELPLKQQTVRERKITVLNTMRDKPAKIR